MLACWLAFSTRPVVRFWTESIASFLPLLVMAILGLPNGLRPTRGCVGVERTAPTERLTYVLTDNAAQVYSSMKVSEASSWEVEKAVLTAEYAMRRQEAWQRYVGCRLEAGEAVDVHLGRLERLGGRLGLTPTDLALRVKFFEGLPASIYERAVTHEQAYTAEFGSVLTRVRDGLASRRAVEGHTSAVVTAASSKRQGSSSGFYRCSGDHRVKRCPMKATSQEKAPTKRKVECFRCGSTGHLVRDCPVSLDGQHVRSEDGDRGGLSSKVKP